MTTGALLPASALLCLILAASQHHQRCKQCYLDIPNVGCFPKATECIAKHGQLCMTVKIMEENKLIYRVQGCTVKGLESCGTTKRIKASDQTITISCCDNSHFCNN